MNTDTILNFKTDKKLKLEAKRVADEIGVPLSTVLNAFLKQFVRDKEVTFSANPYQPTPYLEKILTEAEREYAAGKSPKPLSATAAIARLKKL